MKLKFAFAVAVALTIALPGCAETVAPNIVDDVQPSETTPVDENRIGSTVEEATARLEAVKDKNVEEVGPVPESSSVYNDSSAFFYQNKATDPVVLKNAGLQDNDNRQEWVFQFRGFELSPELPGAPTLTDGSLYAITYFDAGLEEGAGEFGDIFYYSVSMSGESYTFDDTPESFDRNFMDYQWDSPGLKKGLIAAVIVPEDAEFQGIAFTAWGANLAYDLQPDTAS